MNVFSFNDTKKHMIDMDKVYKVNLSDSTGIELHTSLSVIQLSYKIEDNRDTDLRALREFYKTLKGINQ